MFADLSPTDKWLVNKDFSEVPPLLIAFREWMKAHGQQNKPLLITEMAVMVPEWMPGVEGEFTPEKIRDDFLYPTLDMVFNTTDPELGYPDDDYHLVQSMWWWSFNMDYGKYVDGEFRQAYNGNLVWSGLGAPSHAPNSMGLSTLGKYWIDYVSLMDDDPNLRPFTIEPLTALSPSGNPITATLHLKIINNSEVAANPPFTVTFKDVDTGKVIDRIVVSDAVEGCGDKYDTVDIQWSNLALGFHKIRAIVDDGNSVVEENETDNVKVFTFFVSGYHLHLPMVVRR